MGDSSTWGEDGTPPQRNGIQTWARGGGRLMTSSLSRYGQKTSGK